VSRRRRINCYRRCCSGSSLPIQRQGQCLKRGGKSVVLIYSTGEAELHTRGITNGSILYQGQGIAGLLPNDARE
jgi:hypothetical protein